MCAVTPRGISCHQLTEATSNFQNRRGYTKGYQLSPADGGRTKFHSYYSRKTMKNFENHL